MIIKILELLTHIFELNPDVLVDVEKLDGVGPVDNRPSTK